MRLRSCLRRALILAAVLIAGAALLWLFRAPLLGGLARAWVVDEAPVKADAIYALGGGLPQRAVLAARLYQEGYAPRILISEVRTNLLQEMELALPESEVTRGLLLKQGVPAAAIQPIGHGLANTYGETLALREWVLAQHATRVLIVTDQFHTRRARRYFQKALRGTGASLRVLSVASPNYSLAEWWRSEEGMLFFHSELLKSVYYWIKY